MKAVGDRKTCSTCRGVKALGEFHRNRHRPDGLHSDCKSCVRAAGAKWRRENPEKKAKQNRAKNLQRDYYKYAFSKYGMTPGDFDAMPAAQRGVCAICGGVEPGERWLHVDHCHSTGRVRGLLCGHCNKGLGLFRDNTEFLAKAIEYLRQGIDPQGPTGPLAETEDRQQEPTTRPPVWLRPAKPTKRRALA